MNKRKQDDDPPTSKQEPTNQPIHIATPVRAAQICGYCHQPKAGRMVIYNGEQMPVPHARTCAGRCINPDICTHKTHRATKKIKQKATSLDAATKAAILAGFKPQEDTDFKTKWEEHLKQNGLTSSSLPGPGQLNMMIQACKNYAVEQVQKISPAVSMSSESANSVVRLFETGLVTSTPPVTSTTSSTPTTTSTSTSTPSSTKHQCDNCSWICDTGVNVGGTKCIMCDVGDMVKARSGATFCPKIFKSAIRIVRNSTSTPTSTSISTSTPISTSTLTSTPTSTPTSTSTSTSTCSHAYITPMDAHDIHDLTFEYEDDFPLPVAKSPGKTYADASTQTQHSMEYPHLGTSTSTPLKKIAAVTDAFACKKPLTPRIIQSNKENTSHVANVSA